VIARPITRIAINTTGHTHETHQAMADVVLGNPELYFITGAVRVGVPAPWGCEKYCVNGTLAGNCCLAWGNDDCRNGTLARRVTAKVERLWQTLGL